MLASTAESVGEAVAGFERASVDVTVREDHVRASVAIFNNTMEVDRMLSITRRLVEGRAGSPP